jgi:hypothetical protein
MEFISRLTRAVVLAGLPGLLAGLPVRRIPETGLERVGTGPVAPVNAPAVLRGLQGLLLRKHDSAKPDAGNKACGNCSADNEQYEPSKRRFSGLCISHGM